jgi:hypothetical protein
MRTATISEPTGDALTVPDVADRIGLRVDRLRLLLRTRPDLASLFRRAGPLRVLAPERVETLRSMLQKSPTS